jgi:hypothetical protein
VGVVGVKLLSYGRKGKREEEKEKEKNRSW